MLLTLSGSNEVSRAVLPEKVSGKYSVSYRYFADESETVLMVEADGGNWKLLCGSGSEMIVEGAPVKEYLVEGDYISLPVYLRRTGETVTLTIERISRRSMTFRKLLLMRDGSFTIGTDEYCDLRIEKRSAADYMIQIGYSASNGFYISKMSERGIYKNWRRTEQGVIKAGDLILIGSFRFVFGKNFIAYDRCEQVRVNNGTFFSEYVPATPNKEIQYYFDEEYEHSLFFCSPRLKKELSPVTVAIDYPPQSSNNNSTPAAFTLGPSITMGLSSAVTAGFTVVNQMNNGGSITTAMPSVIMASSMLLSSIMWPVATRTYERHRKKKNEKKRKVKYIEYLREKEQLINSSVELQRSIMSENNPALAELAGRIDTRDRALWERMYGQSDFLSINAGSGRIAPMLTISTEAEKFSLDEDILRKEAEKLITRDVAIENGPVEMSLLECPIVGIIGERRRVLNYIKGWIIQLVALYSYEDLGLIVIYDRSEHDFWKCCRWFPHIWNSDKDIRLIASDAEELKSVGAEIEKIRSCDAEKRYVIISASRRLAMKADFIGRIIKEISDSVFSVIALYDSINYLPKECSRVIDLISDSGARIYGMSSDNTGADEITVADASGIDLSSIAVSLSNIMIADNSENFTLLGSYTFLEMLGVNKIEHINCLRRWSDNNPVESLKAPIGIDSHGDMCMLDLHQKAHGPHGLIAGMTGSGKSEFIMTMILSLAVNYHPDELSFILIDYKGGGMANAFKDLPHTAGIITNLDGAAITRSLVSVESELKRRQRIFGETEDALQTSNLDIYKYQKLYRDGKVSEPLPHLIIVSDEFAELKVC